MVKNTGAREVQQRLMAMGAAGAGAKVAEVLFAAGEAVQVEAQLSITRGAVSGAGHVPSKPGEPPNADTHVLADNIETVQVSPVLVEVSSNAPYAAHLEFGTSRMAERPYMRPAVKNTAQERAGLWRQLAHYLVGRSNGR